MKTKEIRPLSEAEINAVNGGLVGRIRVVVRKNHAPTHIGFYDIYQTHNKLK